MDDEHHVFSKAVLLIHCMSRILMIMKVTVQAMMMMLRMWMRNIGSGLTDEAVRLYISSCKKIVGF